jgi:putative ABC transport system permease protein
MSSRPGSSPGATGNMQSTRLVLRSASYHWRTNLAVTLGVAAAVSVLAGALLVGDSVRGSLRDIAVGRLGRAEQVVSSAGFFRDALAEGLRAAGAGTAVAPLVVASGFVTHEATGRRAAGVLVYGVDERFWRFHGLPSPAGIVMSPALASELGAAGSGDVLLIRLQKPSAIPIESLFGRKEDVARTVRLDVTGVLPPERLGEFALRPQQEEVRAVFAPLTRIQRDLGVAGKVNTILLAGGPPDIAAALRSALTLDDGAITVRLVGNSTIAVESATGIVSDGVESAARQAGTALGLAPLPVFTYLANTIRKGDRRIPYSLVTATDLAALRADDGSGREAASVRLKPDATGENVRLKAHATGESPPLPDATGESADPIVLNEWAARELGAAPGDRIDLDYFLWDPAGGLTSHTATFTLERVVAIAGLAADPRLAPEYPGITAANSLSDWDPPFPVDLSRVRPQDEQYWKDHRTTPKAFIAFERGRELWRTRYGSATSIRFRIVAPDGRGQQPDAADLAAVATRLRARLRELLPAASFGVASVPVRQRALDASAGATNFGEYFTYFSFFLMASALLLAVLFFRLGVEQRLRQIGILRAAGFTSAHVRRLLLAEALVLAAFGSIVGMAGALAYGRLIVHGLGTWWIGAVGTTRLQLHVSWISLGIGAAAGVLASALCVIVSLRAVARVSPRALLSAAAIDVATFDVRRSRRVRALGLVCLIAGLGMLAAGFANRAAQTGMFFGAGASLLVACMCVLSSALRARDGRRVTGRGAWPLWRLGFRSAAFRPSRSVLSAALIAAAAFIIVSLDAFRRGGQIEPGPHSGTGGFALIGRSEVPIVQNPNEASGREALVLSPVFERTRFTRFRLRPGEDASCLNLYRPTNPTIVAPERGFIESGRFAFAASLAETEAERANPWRLLERDVQDGVVPVVADATSLEYVLHASLGDTFSIDIGADRPLVLRFVGALRDSVLQGELVMSEKDFVRLFPAQQGYRVFLIDAPEAITPAATAALAGTLERELSPFGFDAVATADRLVSFHRVENTYLSTFQALGGLGLLLGTIGLAAIMFRNVLERRRELALLRAVGYDAHRISIMIVAEAAVVLGAGLAAGAGCAAVAIAPAWLGRGGALPGPGLIALLLAVGVAGLVSSILATRAALRGNVLQALRAE